MLVMMTMLLMMHVLVCGIMSYVVNSDIFLKSYEDVTKLEKLQEKLRGLLNESLDKLRLVSCRSSLMNFIPNEFCPIY